MATALDSAYEWGITPQNAKNLSLEQLQGLGSLRPRSGLGLGTESPMAALNPYGKLPTPRIGNPVLQGGTPEQAGKTAFSFMEDPQRHLDTAQIAAPENVGANPTPGSATPYFDPNYPEESMLALKNWLSPQIQKGVAPALNARGLGYSGVGAYEGEKAQNYLSQLAPMGQTGAQATADDFRRLYGPDITNSLIKGREGIPGQSPAVAPSIPGATPYSNFGTGVNGMDATFLSNPNYAPGNGTPEFGLQALGGGYAPSPGYFYDPNHMPDASKMPWLEPATPYGEHRYSPNV